ncbi:hypothetical protein D9M69_608840 [compost metagenome]
MDDVEVQDVVGHQHQCGLCVDGRFVQSGLNRLLKKAPFGQSGSLDGRRHRLVRCLRDVNPALRIANEGVERQICCGTLVGEAATVDQ